MILETLLSISLAILFIQHYKTIKLKMEIESLNRHIETLKKALEQKHS